MPSTDAVQWTQVGIGHGGGCPFIKIHPADPNVVFETTDMGTSYMSMDGSRTYRSVRNSAVSYPHLYYVCALDWSASDPDVGYAGTSGDIGAGKSNDGLFKTTDRGRTWQSVGGSTFLIRRPYRSGDRKWLGTDARSICAVAVDPDDPNVVYAGIGNFIQDWGCRSWGGPAGGGHAPRGADGIRVSRDGGDTWAPVGPGIPREAMLRRMVITRADSPVGKLLLAATSHGFFLSADEGKSWEKRPSDTRDYVTAVDTDYVAEKTLPHDCLMDLASAFHDGKLVLHAVLRTQIRRTEKGWAFAGGLFRSDDLGGTWTDRNGNLHWPANPRLRSAMGPYIAEHLAYQELMADPDRRRAMAYDGYDPDPDAHAAAMDRWRAARDTFNKAMPGRAKSRATEHATRRAHTPSVLGQFISVRVDPHDPNVLYVVNRPFEAGRKYFPLLPVGVWKTTDGGENWVCITRKSYGWRNSYWRDYKPVGEPEINVPDGRQVATGTRGQGFPRGAAMSNFLPFDLCRAEPDVLIFYALQKMYRSEDGGKTWIDSANRPVGEHGGFIGRGNSNVCVNDFDISPASDDIYFACQDKGLLVSPDNGTSIKKVLDSANFCRHTKAVAFDLSVPGKCYFAHIKPGGGPPQLVFFKTKDFGKSFEGVIRAGNRSANHTYTIPIPEVQHTTGTSVLLVDPLSPPDRRTLFLGNSVGMPYILAYAHGRTRTGGGVHVSHDEGATWQLFDEGLEGSSHEVTTLAAASDGTILLGMRLNVVNNRTETRFGGVWKLNRNEKRWQKLEGLPMRDVRHLAFDPANPQVIYAAGGCGVQRAGFDKVADEAFTNGGVCRSDDGGKTWTKILEAPIADAVAVAPWNGEVVYCALRTGRNRGYPIVSPGLYRSTDRGATWHRASAGIATPRSICGLKFNPRKRGEVWCITWASGAYKAVDPSAD
jgi:photosystem II stability/assembly factor-like uncharacterized protein